MARRNFPTRDATWLLARLAEVELELAGGKVRTSFGSGDVTFSAQMTSPPETRQKLLMRELFLLDPVTYAAYALDDRTKPAFS